MMQHQSSDAHNILTPQESFFFNRAAEQTRFAERFAAKPTIKTVLVGPPNCGKTTFLKYLVSQLSKQNKLAHVVSATSDYFLANGLTNDKFKVEVLVDVTEQEGREFVYGTAMGAIIAYVAGSIGGMTAEELLQKLKAFEAENPILKSKQSGGRGGGNANGATVQAKAKALWKLIKIWAPPIVPSH
ncbi:hypothetical protein KSW81_007879 [Nannochloris sp. 'desiccata']|nr:hypothetical protein KSW81_007879 [Chlorella desiccata (nom. nud.)]